VITPRIEVWIATGDVLDVTIRFTPFLAQSTFMFRGGRWYSTISGMNIFGGTINRQGTLLTEQAAHILDLLCEAEEPLRSVIVNLRKQA
jgi:hypothetical protein